MIVTDVAQCMVLAGKWADHAALVALSAEPQTKAYRVELEARARAALEAAITDLANAQWNAGRERAAELCESLVRDETPIGRRLAKAIRGLKR